MNTFRWSLSEKRCLDIELIVREGYMQCRACDLVWDGYAQHQCPFVFPTSQPLLIEIILSCRRWKSNLPFEFAGFKFEIGEPSEVECFGLKLLLAKYFRLIVPGKLPFKSITEVVL